MNLSTAIFLVNRDVRAIQVQYEKEEEYTAKQSAPLPKNYVFKTLDQTIKKGDLVVVPTDTRYKFTVVKVIEADVDIDYDSTTQYKWIAARFDPAVYEDILAKEEPVIATVRKAEFMRKRNELAASLSGVAKESFAMLELASKEEEPPTKV